MILLQSSATLERCLVGPAARVIQRSHRLAAARSLRESSKLPGDPPVWLPRAYRGRTKETPRMPSPPRNGEYLKSRKRVTTSNFARKPSPRRKGEKQANSSGLTTNNRTRKPSPPRKYENQADSKGIARHDISGAHQHHQHKHHKKEARKRMEKKVAFLSAALHENLLPLAKKYRAVFSPDTLEETGDSDLATTEKKGETTIYVKSVVKQMQDVMVGIHESEIPIQWSQIEKTEDMYRGISRLLQDTAHTSAELSKFEEDDLKMHGFVDLAEFALRSLVTLGSDRALIVESAKKWSKPEPDSRFPWISSLFHSKPEDHASKSGLMAHEDPAIMPSLDLFRTVVDAIASEIQTKGTRTHTVEAVRAAGRVIEILDLMPPGLEPHPVMGKVVLELFSSVGTLESARISYQFYQTGHNSEIFQFSLVLQAYLEAAEREKDPKKLETIARESLDALETHWNLKLPSHRIERIKQCSLVLRIFTLANLGALPEMCEVAHGLIKRALGDSSYEQLLTDFFSDSKSKVSVDTQILPLVNYLIQFFASSGDPERIGQAKKMLRLLTISDREGLGASILYPNVDTFNLVIQSVLEQYESERPGDEEACKQLDFALSGLEYMLARSDTGCLPDDQTFNLLFRLIIAIKPAEMGDRAEDLLSKMEIRRYLSRANPVKISLKIYHRVLTCWLESARLGNADHACLRGIQLLEKLEIQSMPLILHDADTAITKARDIYDMNLRPSITTYNILLKICVETMKRNPNEFENTFDVAFAVLRRVAQRDMLPSDEEVIKLFKTCISYLPEESSQRHVAETFLQEATDEKNISSFVDQCSE